MFYKNKIDFIGGFAGMSAHRMKIMRMMKFIAEMKKNNYPNAHDFAKKLRCVDLEENIPIACSARTIARDIKELMEDFKAPMRYDSQNRGYYLLNKDWEFTYPLLSEELLGMSLLGARLASNMLPEPLKGDLDLAVNQALTTSNGQFFDEAMIESLICASGLKADIDPKIFKTVFYAWCKHQMLKISYQPPNGPLIERQIEPHIIAFHKGVWYIKGFQYGTKDIKVLAVQRLVSVEFGGDCFVVDKKLLESTQKDGLFNFEKVSGIRLRCDATIEFYLREHQKTKEFTVERQSNGSLIVTLKPAIEHDVIRWILGESGKIEVLEPDWLREKVASAAKAVFDRNS
jgi:predicted DNA-binding transcriptional regulator YafY